MAEYWRRLFGDPSGAVNSVKNSIGSSSKMKGSFGSLKSSSKKNGKKK